MAKADKDKVEGDITTKGADVVKGEEEVKAKKPRTCNECSGRGLIDMHTLCTSCEGSGKK